MRAKLLYLKQIMTQPVAYTHVKESAGGVMVGKDFVPTVLLGTTLAKVRDLLKEKSRDYESVGYIYVTDRATHLRGVFSIREFFIHQNDEELVDDIMHKDLITVRPHAHQERAALLALQHNLKSLPVVDKNGAFLGAILAGTLLKILDKEAIEDVLRLRGMYFNGPYDDLLRMSVFTSIKHRLPWLLLGLFGGFLAASIVSGFENLLSQYLILAAFIPLIVYMADAVGTQMEAFIIRDFALHPSFSLVKYFFKQVAAVGIIGLIIGALLSGISFLLYQNKLISIVLGAALFCAVLSSVVTGLFIPALFRKLQFDPANASGPVATIIQDVLSVSVYFFIASLML